MVDAKMSAQNLMSQLSVILNTNLEHATNFEEAVALNNAGLPFDMLLNTRSKKSTILKIEKNNSASSSKPVLIPASSVPGGSLFQTPNLLLYQSGNGTMGCFVTLPVPVSSTGTSILPKGPHPLVSSAASPDQATEMSKIRTSNISHRELPESNVLGLLSKLSTSFQHSRPIAAPAPPLGASILPEGGTKDYDPSEFSKFATTLSHTDSILPLHSSSSCNTGSVSPVTTCTTVHPKPASTSLSRHSNEHTSSYETLVSSKPGTSSPQAQQPLATVQSSSLDTSIFDFGMNPESSQPLFQLTPSVQVEYEQDAPLSPLTQLMNSFADDNPVSSHTPMTSTELSNLHFPPAAPTSSLSTAIDTHLFGNNQCSFNTAATHNAHQQASHHLLEDYSNPKLAPEDLRTPLFQLSSNSCSSLITPFPGSTVPAHEYEDLESLMKTIISDPVQPTSQQPPANPTVQIDFTSGESNPTNMELFDPLSITSLSETNTLFEASPCAELELANSLSVPDLSTCSDTSQPIKADELLSWSQFVASQHGQASTSARSSSCLSNISGFLQDIPEGTQMELEDFTPENHQLDTCVPDYNTSCSSIPSSPGQASISSHSSASLQDIFDSDSPSVLELCEMLSESKNVEQDDFSHLTLTG